MDIERPAARPLRAVTAADAERELAWRAFVRDLTATAATEPVQAVLARDGELWRSQLLLTVAAIGARRSPGPDESEAMVRAVGAGCAGRDVSVADLIRAVTADDERIGRHARAALDASPYRDPFLLSFMSHQQAWSAWTLHAIIAGHRFADRRRDHSRPRDFVERLLTGGLTRAEVAAGIDEFGLDADGRYCALRGRVPGTTDVQAIERELELADRPGRRTGMVAVIGGEVYGFLLDDPLLRTGFTAGLSRPTELGSIAGGFRLATRALDAALAGGLTGLVRIEDIGIRAAVVSDVEVTGRLLRRYVEPFGDGEGGNAILDTVERYLANCRRPGQTGRDLYVHTNTVRYRVSRFEAVTGRSLHDVQTMVEVWWALQARRIRPPTRPVVP